MDCFESIDRKLNGKKNIVFKRPMDEHLYKSIKLPCRQCTGCKLEYSRQWAIRCNHEADLHKDKTFITLTYSAENLPEDGSLNKTHFKLFMKRLRKKFPLKKIRFFHCGEYGENFGRPHYHAIIFGLEFPDKTEYKKHNEQQYYISEILNKIWGKGQCIIGQVTFESAAYVARYILKKINGEAAEKHYFNHNQIDYSTGEVLLMQKEYATMSLKPGIGNAWLKKYTSDVYPSDEVIINGRQVKPPKYYDGLYELTEPEKFEIIKSQRVTAAKKQKNNNTKERLAVRETICEAKLKSKKREYHGT